MEDEEIPVGTALGRATIVHLEESLQALSLRDAVHLVAIYILVVGCILKAEARGEDGDFYLLAQAVIVAYGMLAVDAFVEALHKLLYLTELRHHQSFAIGSLTGEDGHEQPLGLVDIVAVEQGSVECRTDGMVEAVDALGIGCGDDSHAAILQHRADIVEIGVDLAAQLDDIDYAACCHAEGVVGHLESLNGRLGGIDLKHALIVDDHEGIDMLGHLLEAQQGLVDAVHALIEEGYGNDAHGEDAHLPGYAGNDGCSSSAGASAEASGDKDHAGAVAKEGADIIGAILGGELPLAGITTHAKAVGAELYALLHGRLAERGCVGVAHGKGDIVKSLLMHIAHSIATAATYAQHLDDARPAFLEALETD